MGSLCIERGSVSPLQEARRNMQYWADMRAPKGDSLGGPDGVGASFLQAAAEAIPQPDETYDVVGALCRSGSLTEHAGM